MSNFREFLIPFDFSDHARAALTTAIDLANRVNADLHLVHVLQPPSYAYAASAGTAIPAAFNMEEVRSRTEATLQEVASGIANFAGRVETHVVEGSQIAAEIQGAAEKLGADLIIMGTHGRTGLAHAFLGSVAERTLRTAPCPVLTVQARENA